MKHAKHINEHEKHLNVHERQKHFNAHEANKISIQEPIWNILTTKTANQPKPKSKSIQNYPKTTKNYLKPSKTT